MEGLMNLCWIVPLGIVIVALMSCLVSLVVFRIVVVVERETGNPNSVWARLASLGSYIVLFVWMIPIICGVLILI